MGEHIFRATLLSRVAEMKTGYPLPRLARAHGVDFALRICVMAPSHGAWHEGH
jgi:hypothetical protein